ncbi:MAG TPA: ATP-binding protein [Methyloversatilis sp.]
MSSVLRVVHTPPVPELNTRLRLWLLRLLVPLGAHRAFLDKPGYRCDRLAAALGLASGNGDDDYDPRQAKARLLRLHEQAEQQAAGPASPPCLQHNLARLSALAGLSDLDRQVLEFVVHLHNERLLDDTADWLGALSSARVFHALSVLLDASPDEVRTALGPHGVLARSGLVTVDCHGVATLRGKLDLLSSGFADRIASADADPVSLLRDVVSPSPPASLTLDDYPHIEPTLAILRPYLKKALATRRAGVNVFVHGAPGTGKSELARVLAHDMGCGMFEVASEDADGDPVNGERRLRAFRAAQSFFAGRPNLILFDEVEDVFGDGNEWSGRKSTAQMRKAWMNRTLEDNPVPALWLSNSISGLDPAFLRRFDLVFELPVPPRRQRMRILQTACGDLLDAPALGRIAASAALAPAVVTRAAAVANSIRDDLTAAAAATAFEQIINSTLRAQGHEPVRQHDPDHLPEAYDPAFIEADTDLAAVAQGLQRTGAGRLCLYGPPGTGKTAWGRWLADLMDAPLLVRRASDLLSKYLGESERNIARAFRQAEEDGAVLLLDEVDGFLLDRRSAAQGWEVSMTNEMLTQMESFAGVFIASTNLMAGLDQAALRRFDLKVKFGYLGPDQVEAMLEHHCRRWRLPSPSPDARLAARRLDRLTPGDFAVLARQHRFRPFGCVQTVLDALQAECTLKEGGLRSAMGFVS